MAANTIVTRALKRLGVQRSAKGAPLVLPPRAAVPGRRGVAAVALMWNEAPDLREWIEFHRLAGIEHLYLYDDGSTDETAELVAPYVTAGFVTCIPWSAFSTRQSMQRYAYGHAVCTFGSEWRWLAFIDLDEFLFATNDEPLGTALARYDDLRAVVVPWHMYGSHGHDARPNGLVIENYQSRTPFPPPPKPSGLLNWKSIVDPLAVAAIDSPHFFILADGRRGGYTEDRAWVGEQRPRGWQQVRSNVFRLNHYFTKSQADFTRRRSAGRSVAGRASEKHRDRAQGYANAIEAAPRVEDGSALRFVPELRRRLGAPGRSS